MEFSYDEDSRVLTVKVVLSDEAKASKAGISDLWATFSGKTGVTVDGQEMRASFSAYTPRADEAAQAIRNGRKADRLIARAQALRAQ